MTEDLDELAVIDRLAADELDDAARRDLFVWLDREPSRWRRCALALLEARELERACDHWQSEVPRPTVATTRAPAVRQFRHHAVFALAASLLIAFSLGLFARGFWVAGGPMIAELPKPAASAAPRKTDAKSPSEVAKRPDKTSDKSVTTVAAAPPGIAPGDPIPPYIRSQWERRGYQLNSRPARLPVVLPDGRRLMLPVDELQLNYVGQRTY